MLTQHDRRPASFKLEKLGLEGKGTCETPEVTERRNKFFTKMKIAR